ncbi:MAG: hypothetical protein ACJAWV_002913 [Flammeovirgaceae bacterium]|jgi:hypothetical protein
MKLEKSSKEMKELISKQRGASTNSSQYSIYKNNTLLINRLHYNPSDKLLTVLDSFFEK